MAVSCSAATTPARARVVMLASTIGPIDAGIVDALEDAFLRRTGITVRHVGAGTGAALQMATTGSFDVVMAHARALEDKFVADGFGVDRRDVRYNDFVVLGPAGDPAGIRGETRAAEAFRKIAQRQAPFITRGDQSGTHVKEMEIWKEAGLAPAGPWYVTYERGAAGNAVTTRHASQRGAYLLMDRATVLTLRGEIALGVLVEKDPALLNHIAVIQVNPARFPRVNAADALAFVEWLESMEAQELVQRFGVQRYGESLFFPNSNVWHRARRS
jgi:tungstate transport system substrate-binding protein